MITREYFFHAKYAHNDNTGKYSYHCNTLTVKSLLPKNSGEIFEIAVNTAISNLEDHININGLEFSDIELTALNRI